MWFNYMKSLMFVLLVAVIPFVTHADENSKKMDDTFKSSCVKAWMEKSDKVTDKASFKNFGEKYCDCAANQPLDTDDQMEKAALLCMSQLLLKNTMDAIKADSGLTNLSEENLKVTCEKSWKLIYPDMNASKRGAATFCACSIPKLIELNKKRDGVTDKEWYGKIDGIARECSGVDKPVKPPKSEKKH